MPLALQTILNEVSNYYKQPIPTLRICTRKRKIVQIRQIYYFLAVRYSTATSHVSIGRFVLQGRGAVANGIKTITALQETDKQIKADLKYLVAALNQKV